jgi:hypothetical protein
MDILRNLFGNLTSGIIRLAVTVGILAAVYFFLLRPALETTNKAIDSANRSYEQSFGTNGADVSDVSKTIEDVNRQIQVQIQRSFKVTENGRQTRRLVRCIQNANGNVKRIERCTRKF